MGSAGALPGRLTAGALPGHFQVGSAPAVPRQCPGGTCAPGTHCGAQRKHWRAAGRTGAPGQAPRAITRAGKIAPRRLAAGARSMVLLAKLSHAQIAWNNAHDGTTHDPPRAGQRLARRVAAVDRGQRRAGVHAATTRYRQVSLRLARPARSSDSERWRGAIARALLARSCDVHGAHRKPQRFRTAGRRLFRSTPSRPVRSSTSQRS